MVLAKILAVFLKLFESSTVKHKAMCLVSLW